MTLNKIEKSFNKAFTGLKRLLKRFQIGFLKVLDVRAWNPPARQYSQYGLNLGDSALLPSW